MTNGGMVKEFGDYSSFVKLMEGAGWYREQLSIDENNTFLVTTHSVAVAASGRVVEITCPAGRIITTKGTEQIPAGADRASAHALTLRLAGTDENEMNVTRKVKIEKMKPSEEVTMLSRDFYSMFTLTRQIGIAGTSNAIYKGDNEIYRWRRGIVLYGEEIMRISVVNTDLAIDEDYVQMQMDLDLWTLRM